MKNFISVEMKHLLMAASSMANQTDGLFNPFVLPAIQKAGYYYSRVPGHEKDLVDDHSDKAVVTIDRLEIGDNWAKIPYGTAIDFGGCGKGYLADQLRKSLPGTISGYWFSFGGDIALGGVDASDRPWNISVQSADDSSKNIATLSLPGVRGIATSGITVHQGRHAGKHWHHIIDPRTHLPADTDVLLATVCDNDSTLRADVLASCAVILGSNKGMRFLKKAGIASALLQFRNFKGETEMRSFGNGILPKVIYA